MQGEFGKRGRSKSTSRIKSRIRRQRGCQETHKPPGLHGMPGGLCYLGSGTEFRSGVCGSQPSLDWQLLAATAGGGNHAAAVVAAAVTVAAGLTAATFLVATFLAAA